MVDNAQKVEVQAELDASQVRAGGQQAAQALRELLSLTAQLEQQTRALFTGQGGQLPRQLAELTRNLQAIQQLPLNAAQVNRINRQIAGGGGPTSASNAAVQGVISNMRTDPALQNLKLEREANKVLEARAEIYRRIRSTLPEGATALRTSQVYRQALAVLGDMPEKATTAYREWVNRTMGEVRDFERDWTREQARELDKRQQQQLRVARQTASQEQQVAREHQREMNRLFGRDMNAIMLGNTPEDRRRAAGESVNRIRDYANRRGLTGFNEQALLDRFEDAETRRAARDMSRVVRPPREPLSDDQRAANAYRQRDAFMNYNGGANRLASRFQFVGDFAAVGAVMGTAMYAGRSTVQLQSELKNLQAITQATDQEMNSLQGTIFAVGQATKYSTTEIAQAATVMGQAGYSANQIRDALPAIANLATAAGGDLANTVATVTSVLSIFDMSIDRTTTVSNQLAEALNGSKLSFEQLSLGLQYAGNVAADGGVQFEEMTAALGAMANAGIRSGSTLGTGLRALIQELENPSDKFLEWLRGVGLTANDVDVRTQGLAGAISNLTAKSFDSGQAMNVFEIRAASAFSALSNNLDVMADLENDMVNTEAATEGAGTQMDSLAAQGQRLGNALTELTTVAGAPLLEFLQGAIGALATFLSTMASGGPVIQIIVTALTMMIGIGVLSWMGRMAAGFIGMNSAAVMSSRGLIAAAIASGNFSAAAAIATSSVRAFTVALLANPATWVVVGLTALATTFGLVSSASAASANRIEEWKTKANEAAAESQKYSDRVSELGEFMEMVAQRSNNLANESVFAGQMAETAAAKFSDWGLVLEGNINTVDRLIASLANLSREQATAALNQKELEREAKQGERDEILSQNPWGSVRSATDMLGQYNFGGATGAAPWAADLDRMMGADTRRLLDKARNGSLTRAERDTLSGQLRALKTRVRPEIKSRIDTLLGSLNASTLNSLFDVDREIENLGGQIATLTITSSAQAEATNIRGSELTRQLAQSDRDVASIRDPAAQALAGADRQRALRQQSTYNERWLESQADQLLQRNPSLQSSLARRAELAGVSVRDLIVAQLRGNAPGFNRVDQAGGNLDALDNPTAIRSRERSLRAQIANANQISEPGLRDSTRSGLQTELREVIRRRLALDNRDLDDITLEYMLDEEMNRSGADMSRTQSTSEQRAARDRAVTLKREVKALESRIEGASINTQAPAGVNGSASEQRAMQMLMGRGLTVAQAAGIVGNLGHESAGMNTRALGDNGTAFGLAQWRGDRLAALEAFARRRGTGRDDFDTQMEFLWEEMQQRGDLARVQGTTTAAEAAEVFARKYERPRGHDGALSGLAGWSDRLARSTRLAGNGTTTQIDQSAVQALLDEWKATNISQIRAEAQSQNISDAELSERLGDFEIMAAEYFNDVLSGNAARMKGLMADAAARNADGYSAQMQVALRVGGKNLDEAITEIEAGYAAAVTAAIEASDAEFRAQNPGVDPAISADAQAKRQVIQDNFATKIIDATLASINAFFEGQIERANNDFERQRLEVERGRASDARLGNFWGSRRLGDVTRALGDRRNEMRDIDDARINRDQAQSDYTIALKRQAMLQSELDAAGTDEARNRLGSELATASQNVETMATALERAQMAFEAINSQAPGFASMTDAWKGALTIFADQAGLTRGVFEDVGDGLLNTLNTTKAGFKSLVTDVVTGSKSMGDAFKDFTLSILQSLLDLAAEILAKQILSWLINFAMGAMGGGFGGPTSTPIAAGSIPIAKWHGGPIRMSGGGRVPGTNSSRDHVLINAMPGEFMMSKSAVDMVGEDNLRAMNAQANSRVSRMPHIQQVMKREPDTTNVWIVAPGTKPGVGKNDIVAVIADDILTNGSVKKLIKSVAMGG